MKTIEIIVLVGIPASGKSTHARKILEELPQGKRYCILERDYYRAKLQSERGIINDSPITNRPTWDKWKWKDEGIVTKMIEADIPYFIDHVDGIILADTNINRNQAEAYAAKVAAIAKEKGIGSRVSYKIIDVSWEEALRRDAARKDGVGVSVLYKMYNKFLENLPTWWDCLTEEQQKRWQPILAARCWPRDHLPQAIIVDVDGTLADMEGIRGPFEWHRVGEDKPREVIIAMVNGIRKTLGVKVIIMSGRDGVCFEETEKWLLANGVVYDHFYIRTAGDMRKDTYIKSELYFSHVHEQYNVIAVIDDRPCVCRMWRDLGLDVIQVADPHLEF